MTAEQARLDAARDDGAPWKMWGPYLSERQWGTVREDYSENGDAWNYFTHDQARSRAYRWGEDGLGGISDDRQLLCFALALWNGEDAILKERLFGLSNSQANHGEDVKEYYYYLDSTPTHSYMKYLYKYPQAPFPYAQLVEENARRSREEMEYELIDTGVFNQDRYFDVFVEYAKAGPHDILIKISAANRRSENAALHVLPTLWFRNTWSWEADAVKPALRVAGEDKGVRSVRASHADLGKYTLYCEGADALLFTENETNTQRLFNTPNATSYVKDGIDRAVREGAVDAVNAEGGTKVAAHYWLELGPGETKVIRLRLAQQASDAPFGEAFDVVFAERLKEADAFYEDITPDTVSVDAALVMRQALAGMLWSKQFYYYDVERWLGEHGADPWLPSKKVQRNDQWYHMVNADIISMPDKWEYPWYAAWDLAFHTIALQMVDPEFARDQLDLMLREHYLHPNGQIPAYEWNFGDVNPPVHAWAANFAFQTQQILEGKGDVDYLQHAFQKLLTNFTWWVNRKDPTGKNVFGGGFLGLDNIGVFDRSAPLPTGGVLEQADGTAWMVLYAQCMMEMAVNLARVDPVYEDMAIKFMEHILYISAAMDRMGENADEMWDEEDGFYYDLLRLPDGSAHRLKVRSMVGLLPLCAAAIVASDRYAGLTRLQARARWLFENRTELFQNVHDLSLVGQQGRRLVSVLNETKLRRVLGRMLDENEFLGPRGIRSLSRDHLEHPFVFHVDGQEYRVQYLPAESNTGMFGGNSNWRGPVWMPMNVLILRALLNYYLFYGNDFKVECPTGSGKQMNLYEVAEEIARRLTMIFLRDEKGERATFGDTRKLQDDPHWRDYILFYEYFHGDNGAGLGASHQTGWTGLVAKLIQLFGSVKADELLQSGARSAITYHD